MTKAKRSLFIRDKPILSSRGMLYKDMIAGIQLKKKSLVVSLKGLVAKNK
jgi:hypothetical protein